MMAMTALMSMMALVMVVTRGTPPFHVVSHDQPIIMMLGDSITQYSVNSQLQGFQALLSNDYIRKADVVNRGLWGWTTKWWLEYLPQFIHEWRMKSPVLMVVELGANDASLEHGTSSIRYVPVEEYAENLRAIIRITSQAFPSCEYLILSPPAVDNKKWSPADKLNNVTQVYAKKCIQVADELNLPVIDLWNATQGKWNLFRAAIAKHYPQLTPNALPQLYPDVPPDAVEEEVSIY
ncbi:hypothetical protein LEN26_015695 [Aphanomyces euteiches]|nr:hypothetical protein LEN26_015695 [Aphanomyces euteiches]KAH9113466.1 hypothetical protein AeMF1_012350 [Aphanomyces euteiches]KAH9183316.1 hypothetical protein AeNC1_014706 [Aphanomyces euteiches]